MNTTTNISVIILPKTTTIEDMELHGEKVFLAIQDSPQFNTPTMAFVANEIHVIFDSTLDKKESVELAFLEQIKALEIEVISVHTKKFR